MLKTKADVEANVNTFVKETAPRLCGLFVYDEQEQQHVCVGDGDTCPDAPPVLYDQALVAVIESTASLHDAINNFDGFWFSTSDSKAAFSALQLIRLNDEAVSDPLFKYYFWHTNNWNELHEHDPSTITQLADFYARLRQKYSNAELYIHRLSLFDIHLDVRQIEFVWDVEKCDKFIERLKSQERREYR